MPDEVKPSPEEIGWTADWSPGSGRTVAGLSAPLRLRQIQSFDNHL